MTAQQRSTFVPLAAAREVATPAATMRTYAAPSGPARATVAVWRTEMGPDAAGPHHAVSEDQVLVVLEGTLRALVGEQEHELGPQDALVLPAGLGRRISAGPAGAVSLWASLPGATARVGDGDPVPVPWAR